MSEKIESTPEKPQDNITPALEFLLGEGEEWLWDDGGIDTAELLYRVVSSQDKEQKEELSRLVEWVQENFPAYLQDSVAAIKEASAEASKADYIRGLEGIIRDIEMPNRLSVNALRLAIIICRDEYIEEIVDAVQYMETMIAPKISNDEEGEVWVMLGAQTKRFSKLALLDTPGGEPDTDGLDIFREFINTLDIDIDQEGEQSARVNPLEDTVENELKVTEINFTPALMSILGQRGGSKNDFDGYETALLLYTYLRSPDKEELTHKLDSATTGAENEVVYSVQGAVEEIKEKRGSRADFVRSLSEIIGSATISNIQALIDAVRLSYRIKAWELADAVASLKGLTDATDGEEVQEVHVLKREIEKFFVQKYAFSPSDTDTSAGKASTPGHQDSNSREDDGLEVFRRFINSLE